ncbi:MULTISPECIES: undecaprenyl-phosphate glucose phosphotransferase [Bacillaceae]|uniref:undecaprenyl-phosphate glucose phosphotransferase n=1 Tax=Bacillaceae TaxID=186817 RepID=UPI002963D495|nr:undecaprenyl-phosphate glucose phosphotransferase [Bacillus infantis]MDW2876427.1 undecaprenyl-phosphate glucose phosphotransferase [Bacillus infantis]
MIRGREKFLSQVYAGVDFVFIQIAFGLAWLIRFNLLEEDIAARLPFADYWFWGAIYAIIYVLAAYTGTLYASKRKTKFASELAKLFQAHVISIFILLSVLFTLKTVDISRIFLLVFFLMSLFTTSAYRYFIKQALRRLRAKGYNKQFVLIVGAGKLGRKYYDMLKSHPEYGMDVVGFLDDYCKDLPSPYKSVLGSVRHLQAILETKLIDEVIIALPFSAYPKYREIILICERAGIRVSIIPDFYDVLPASPHFQLFGDLPVVNVRDVPLDEIANKFLKRVFDIAFALIAIILTLPIMIVIGSVLKLTSPGPIIFKQERVGLNRRTFNMYKFRSMKHMEQSASDTQWTVADDPRRTKLGSFIRKTSLDELPQFFNVLKGDMSVVGPRPERPHFVDQFRQDIPKYMIKHHVRPGITGWAQVSGLRGDTSIADRIEHDVFYIENWTILFDIKIIFKTIYAGLVNKNAY